MGFGNIKIDKADQLFSRYIRLRDKFCMRCGSKGNGKEGINGLQASHYYGRRRESTRFDPANVDALCAGCHQEWGSTDREAYRVFKVRQLGLKGFKNLQIRAESYMKKDRKAMVIAIKELLKQYEHSKR